MKRAEKFKAWCYLELSGGQRVKIDQEDLERVSKHTWRVIQKATGRLKVVTDVRQGDSYRQISLGQFLMKPPKGKMVYPRRFRDGLDYRKANLIVCTMAERQQILPKNRKGSTSKFKGVSFVRSIGQWRASIKVNGKSLSLGTFATEIDAALAYNEAARQHFGDMAYQNLVGALPTKRRDGD